MHTETHYSFLCSPKDYQSTGWCSFEVCYRKYAPAHVLGLLECNRPKQCNGKQGQAQVRPGNDVLPKATLGGYWIGEHQYPTGLHDMTDKSG